MQAHQLSRRRRMDRRKSSARQSESALAATSVIFASQDFCRPDEAARLTGFRRQMSDIASEKAE